MRWAWLEVEMHQALAWALALFVGYGLVHIPHGFWSVLGWSGVAAVAVASSLMTASALLPAILLTVVAVTRIYAVPMRPNDPPRHPPLALVEPPTATSAVRDAGA